MDEFERDLARRMRETSDGARLEPAQRERLHASVRVRRRARAAWLTGGSVGVLAAACAGLFAVSGVPGGGRADTATVASASPSVPASPPARGLLTVPKGATHDERVGYLEQNATAVCMRAKGYTYTPHVDTAPDLWAAVDASDYAKAKAFRGKYGYGLYSGAVHPDDPKAPMSPASRRGEAPDAAYLASLSPKQLAAYQKALGGVRGTPSAEDAPGDQAGPTGCVGEAQRQVEGRDGQDAAHQKQEWEAAEAEQEQAQAHLDTEPKLVALADSYASCLSARGIAVTTRRPSRIADMVKFQESAKSPAEGSDHLSKSEAQLLLTADVKAAMNDLECGRKFRAAYFPEYHRLDPDHTA
ncbi:hypothetical protein [Streptomyces fuscigenes]|uniref:hypothetical protein n=1 Tax=Streptomyces fuscigenes TaxID=1528880 RepID=UPI001F2299B3|nr:hypothetical protein [Streptomyces fuscigenes]MCF3964183.1 hypothetical protein [Streptomyces fuscigenes]